MVDKTYCASSFLMFRRIADESMSFDQKLTPSFPDMSFERTGITNSSELVENLRDQVIAATQDGKAALALSGGIDSAILAKFMPGGGHGIYFPMCYAGI